MAKNNSVHRLTVRMDEDTYQKLMYWAARRQMSANEYLSFCLDEMIRRENGDFDVPNAMVARVNQLVDVTESLSSNLKSLESVVTSGFDSLLGLTRGDNYLLEQDEGEV